MRKFTMEVSAEVIEDGFRTGNVVRHTVVSKGLPYDAKLTWGGLNSYGNLELHFQSDKHEGEDKHICIELTTIADA